MIRIEFGKDQWHQINNMVQWCRDNLGDSGWLYGNPDVMWCVESAFGNTMFTFRQEQDAILFSLKWK